MMIKHSILIGLFVLLLFSCEKPDPNGCHNAITYYKYLSETARNQTPYFTNPAFDTISFASDKGDTVTFVKTITDSTWYKEEISGNPACDWDKNYYQVLHNTYTTIKGSGTFDVKHSKKNNKYLDIIEFNFNNTIFFIGDYEINDTKHPQYLGDIIKNQISYKKSMYSIDNSGKVRCYLNQSFGIFYIEDNTNNIIWTSIN